MELDKTAYGIGQEVNYADREKIQSYTYNKHLYALGEDDGRFVNIFESSWNLNFIRQVRYADSEGYFIGSLYVSLNSEFVLDLTNSTEVACCHIGNQISHSDDPAAVLRAVGCDDQFVHQHLERARLIELDQ